MPLIKLRILVFSNRRNFDDDKKYTYTCLHWHHDMVMDLAFSVTGECKFNNYNEFLKYVDQVF